METQPETPDQKYQRIYKELYVLFHREELPIHVVVELAEDLILSCAISACGGDQVQAGKDLAEHFIPAIAEKIKLLLADAYPVIHITERETALDAFSTTGIKPN